MYLYDSICHACLLNIQCTRVQNYSEKDKYTKMNDFPTLAL